MRLLLYVLYIVFGMICVNNVKSQEIIMFKLVYTCKCAFSYTDLSVLFVRCLLLFVIFNFCESCCIWCVILDLYKYEHNLKLTNLDYVFFAVVCESLFVYYFWVSFDVIMSIKLMKHWLHLRKIVTLHYIIFDVISRHFFIIHNNDNSIQLIKVCNCSSMFPYDVVM